MWILWIKRSFIKNRFIKHRLGGGAPKYADETKAREPVLGLRGSNRASTVIQKNYDV